MILPIFSTKKLKDKILIYAFTHPEDSWYVRQMASMLDARPGNVSRVLKVLEKEGMFRFHAKGGAKYYSLNKQYPLFNDLKNLVFKTAGIEGALTEMVRQYPQIDLAFIYGSYAKQKETKTSDVDLAVVGELPVGKFTEEIRKLEARFNREINFTHYSLGDFRKEKKKPGGFLNRVLQDKMIILKGSIHG
jgi:predicted nucleotidyltransferase